jgi:hypothetical protein
VDGRSTSEVRLGKRKRVVVDDSGDEDGEAMRWSGSV